MGVAQFECRPIPKGAFTTDVGPGYFTPDEDDAVAWAKANATVLLEQVTIEVCAPGDVSTFAVRTVKHDGFDSGWRCWRDGTHVGAMSLDALFNRRRVGA